MKGVVQFTIVMFMVLLTVSSGSDLVIGMLDVVGLALERVELEELARQLGMSFQETIRLPLPKEFVGFCNQRLKGAGHDGRDRWGTAIWYETARYGQRRLNESSMLGEFVLVSAGPDRIWMSQDDVVITNFVAEAASMAQPPVRRRTAGR